MKNKPLFERYTTVTGKKIAKIVGQIRVDAAD
jgi:Na+-translocating ferredoxin:NAD+ oxidoreductase RnfC subunit